MGVAPAATDWDCERLWVAVIAKAMEDLRTEYDLDLWTAVRFLTDPESPLEEILEACGGEVTLHRVREVASRELEARSRLWDAATQEERLVMFLSAVGMVKDQQRALTEMKGQLDETRKKLRASETRCREVSSRDERRKKQQASVTELRKEARQLREKLRRRDAQNLALRRENGSLRAKGA